MYDYLLIFLSVMGHLLQYFDLYFELRLSRFCRWENGIVLRPN